MTWMHRMDRIILGGGGEATDFADGADGGGEGEKNNAEARKRRGVVSGEWSSGGA